MADLFAAAAEERLRSTAPLAARLRPRTIDDVVGQEHLVGPGRPLRRLVEQDRLTSAIFWGPPGTGKTTLALAVAGSTARAFEQMSAVTAGRQGRARGDRARPAPARRTRPGHDPVPRRDPPLQQGAAGRAAAGGRGRHADADRGDHREPVLRGQPAAAQPLHAVPARAARPQRRCARSSSAGCEAEGATAERRRDRPARRPRRAATGARC